MERNNVFVDTRIPNQEALNPNGAYLYADDETAAIIRTDGNFREVLGEQKDKALWIRAGNRAEDFKPTPVVEEKPAE